jgi:hypothetical protein
MDPTPEPNLHTWMGADGQHPHNDPERRANVRDNTRDILTFSGFSPSHKHHTLQIKNLILE